MKHIGPNIVKLTKRTSLHLFFRLFQQSLDLPTAPTDWRLGRILPILSPETKMTPQIAHQYS